MYIANNMLLRKSAYLRTLHGRDQFASESAEEPLAPVEALGQGGRDADHTHRDARYGQVHDVQILRGPMGLLP